MWDRILYKNDQIKKLKEEKERQIEEKDMDGYDIYEKKT